ncbi:DUF1836 domain-containing protein [Lentilactobacillus kisonensis]|nr:hypothetical protein HMPREF9104_02087 [Lentilactobacillus kisonensis F0435]
MWDELPTLDLHLDQLLALTNQYLSPIIGSQITKTMMHNYFKANIIVPPIKKKYWRTQLAGAIVVGLLKNIFTLNEIKVGLRAILADNSPKVGYNHFVIMFNEQAAKAGTVPSALNSLDLESADTSTIMQYDAVQSILFWLAAKARLAEASTKKVKK